MLVDTRDAVVAIRPATPADLPDIGRLGALLVESHHGLDPMRFIAPTMNTEFAYSSLVAARMQEPGIVVLVAERGSEVVGFTFAGIEPADFTSLRDRAGALYDIVVDPAHRGCGVGRLLLDRTLAELEAFGAPRVILAIAEGNEAARRLYARSGFRCTMTEMTRELSS